MTKRVDKAIKQSSLSYRNKKLIDCSHVAPNPFIINRKLFKEPNS